MSKEPERELKINGTDLLIVEGQDERAFFICLLNFLGIDKVQVFDVGGRMNFSSYLAALSITSDFDKVKRFGFIRDAEENKAFSSFQSMCAVIKKYLPNVALPSEPGEIKNSEEFSCGIFIMPDNINEGMLEDLCLDSVKDTSLYSKAESYVIKAKSLQAEADSKKYNVHKALVQTYLAGLPDIANSIAVAARKRIWDFNSPVFDEVKDFIKKLFLV